MILDRIARSKLAGSQRTYRILIHWGTGRFCFAAFANLTLVRKDLCDGILLEGTLELVAIMIREVGWVCDCCIVCPDPKS